MKRDQAERAGRKDFVRSARRSSDAEPSEKRNISGVGRFVLFVGDEGAVLLYMRGRTVVRRLFASSSRPEHVESLTDLLRRYSDLPVTLLVDVLDQQYVSHVFPPVSAMSLGGLIKRRIGRDFRDEDLNASLTLGRDKGGRKEWKCLLISLGMTPLLSGWISLIQELPNPLRGIYLAPVEGISYVQALHGATSEKDKKYKWQMLISHHKVSGFRQVVVCDGKLVFTRVSQVMDADVPAVIAGSLEQEVISSLEYLRRLGLTDMGALELMVVSSKEVREALDLQRFNAGCVHALLPVDVAQMLKLGDAARAEDRYGDVVMAAFFALQRRPVLRLLTPYIKKLSELHLARRGVQAFAALVMLGCGVSSALMGMDLVKAYRDTQTLTQEKEQLDPQLIQKQSERDNLKTDRYLFASGVLALSNAYFPKGGMPLESVRALLPFFNDSVRLAKFTWRLAAPTQAGSVSPAGEAVIASNEIPSADLEVEFVGDYPDLQVLTRRADQWVKALTAQLKDYTVTVDSYPWSGSLNQAVEISLDAPKSGGGGGATMKKITLHIERRNDAIAVTN